MKHTTSASCSIAPDSRRSDSWGRRCSPPRCSGARESWDNATTGTSSSLARALSEREMNEISCCRLSESVGPCIICRRSEEHTSELQSLAYLVCRLLLEKKKNKDHTIRELKTINSTRS